jgi:hypothetical protein
MKRITHWQAAFAVCVSLAAALGSLWLFHHFVVNQLIPIWMGACVRDPNALDLNDYLLTRIVVSDGI